MRWRGVGCKLTIIIIQKVVHNVTYQGGQSDELYNWEVIKPIVATVL